MSPRNVMTFTSGREKKRGCDLSITINEIIKRKAKGQKKLTPRKLTAWKTSRKRVCRTRTRRNQRRRTPSAGCKTTFGSTIGLSTTFHNQRGNQRANKQTRRMIMTMPKGDKISSIGGTRNAWFGISPFSTFHHLPLREQNRSWRKRSKHPTRHQKRNLAQRHETSLSTR